MPTRNLVDSSPALSIIILSYNTAALTSQCILSVCKSMEKSDLRWEIIVLDNNSTDASVSEINALSQKNTQIKLIKSNTNLGFSSGNNMAFEQSKGEYILFLNSDIIVLDQSIEKMYEFMKKNQKMLHFCGGKLLNEDQTPQASCGRFYTLPVVFAALFLRGDYWGLTRNSPITTQKVDWVSGSCIMTKREYFSEIQFDKNIFMYMDEVDMLYRGREKGFNTYFFPESKFIHLGSASSKGRTEPILQVYRGLKYFYKKHYGLISQTVLFVMLQLKALVSILVGVITNNNYLKKTYGKALQSSWMD